MLGELGLFLSGAGGLAAGSGGFFGGGNQNRNTTYDQWLKDAALANSNMATEYTRQGVQTQKLARQLSILQHKQAVKTRNLSLRQAERQFSKLVQTRVKDAKAAGIHPLFALGASGAGGGSPVFAAGGAPSGGAAGGAGYSSQGTQGTGKRGDFLMVAEGLRNMMDALDPERQKARRARRRVDEAQAKLYESEAALNEHRAIATHDGGDPQAALVVTEKRPHQLKVPGGTVRTGPTAPTQVIEDQYGDFVSWPYGVLKAADDARRMMNRKWPTPVPKKRTAHSKYRKALKGLPRGVGY